MQPLTQQARIRRDKLVNQRVKGSKLRAPASCQVHLMEQSDPATVKVLPGGYYVGFGECRIATTLGSCVSVCMRDPYAGVGGMNHFMLPSACGGGPCLDDQLSARYGVNAMERLINELIKRGGMPSRLEVKLFGGGHVLHATSSDVGGRNIAFVRQFLRTEGLRVMAEDLGGPCSRKLVYDITSGRVRVKQFNDGRSQLVGQRDLSYLQRVCKEPIYGSVELFDE